MFEEAVDHAVRICQIAPSVSVSLHVENELPSKGSKQHDNLVRDGNTRWAAFRLASRQKALWMLSLTLVVAAARASAQNQSVVPTLETIIARMAQARVENRARFRPYVVTRNYKLFGNEQEKIKSQVIADITFVPPNLKTYTIEESSGGGLGEKVVSRILQSETETTKHYDATDFSPANYDFHFLHHENDVGEQRSYVLEMLPKRGEKNLLRGKIWVDAYTYRVHRVEGQLAKPSSWWVRDVQIVLLYSEVEGMWLQTGTEATARVRIVGPHRMVSNDVKYKISPLVATGPPHQPSGVIWSGKPLEDHELQSDLVPDVGKDHARGSLSGRRLLVNSAP